MDKKEEIEKVTIENLLELLALKGGSIVSTASLNPTEIAFARSENRMFVNENSLGYVYVPLSHQPVKVEPDLDKMTEQEFISMFKDKGFELYKTADLKLSKSDAIAFMKWYSADDNYFIPTADGYRNMITDEVVTIEVLYDIFKNKNPET